MHDCLYIYKAVITSCWDGDTATADIDLGFGIEIKNQKIRLLGINAPELKNDTLAEARVSRDFLRSKILNKTVTIKTHKDKKGKYGRWLAEIFLDEVNINYLMLSEGYAVEY